MHKRLFRLAIAAFVTTVAIGLTADDRSTTQNETQQRDATVSNGTVIIPQCTVKFYRRASLATDRPGIIAEMPFDEGSQIAKDDLVVRLRDEVAVANVEVAKARAASVSAIGMAEKEAEAAAFDLDSLIAGNDINAKRGYEPLYTDGKIGQTRSIKEARDLAVARAEEEVALNQKALEQARAELANYRVKAKQQGVVTQVFKREGEAVQQGEAILEVVDPTVARVEGRLHVSLAQQLHVGMPVTVQVTLKQRRGTDGEPLSIEQEMFAGTLGFIDVEVTPGYNEVRVWAEVPNPDVKLLDNMPVRMTVDLAE